MKKILLLTILSVNICLPINPLNLYVEYWKFQARTTWKVSKTIFGIAYGILELGGSYERGANYNWGLGGDY